MRVNNNLSPLPFYSALKWQKHRLPYANNGVLPLITEANKILPFQITRQSRPDALQSVKLYRVGNYLGDDILISDILPELIDAGLELYRFEAEGYDVIFYPSSALLPANNPEGLHYIEVSDGVESWFSEVFTFVLDVANYLKIEWRNLSNVDTKEGKIMMFNPNFKGYYYLHGSVAMPEYSLEEEGDARNGIFFADKQVSVKKYKINTFAMEAVADMLRLLPMWDLVTIHDKGRIYEPVNLEFIPGEWITQDVLSIEINFITDIIVKMGGYFNNDFNCCGNGGSSGGCVLPVEVNILGENNPTKGSTKGYMVQKIGGNGTHFIQWEVIGGTIEGSSNSNLVFIKWDDEEGTGYISVKVSCDGTDEKTGTKEVSISSGATCTPASSVAISGADTAISGSNTAYTANITGGSGQAILWTVTNGTIIGANDENSVIIQWDEGESSGVVSVSVTCGGVSKSDLKSVAIVDELEFTIVGAASVGEGSLQEYYLESNIALVGASVMWSVSGGVITNNSSNVYESIKITWGAAGSGTVSAVVTYAGNNYTVPVKNITIGAACSLPLYANVSISGDANVLPNSVKTYVANITGGANYSIKWFVGMPGDPLDAEIIGSDTGTSVQIKWGDFDIPSHPGQEVISLVISCGVSSQVTKLMNVYKLEGEVIEMETVPEPSTVAVNTNTFTDFPDFELPEGVLNVAGDGFPLWANEETAPDGKLLMFKKGWTNSFNLRAFAKSKWDPKNIYAFSQFYYMFNQAVRECIAAGINGVVGGIDYGNMDAVTAPGDFWNTNIPYYYLTVEGFKEVGKRMNWGTSDALDQPGVWNIDGNEAVLMIDEEAITDYSSSGTSIVDLMGYVTAGIMEASLNKKHLFWYGHPISPAFNLMNWQRDSNGKYLTSAILDLFKPANLSFTGSGFTGIRWYIDRLGAYWKIPDLSNYKIYKEDINGDIVIDGNGNRVFRDDNFTISLYGRTVNIYKEPHDWIKWNGKKADNSDFYGWQPEFGTFSGVAPTLPYGWSWGNTARPNPSDWRTEPELWVRNHYMQANGAVSTMMFLNYKERGIWDASQALETYKPYQEMRCVGEPWTIDTNSIEAREIGHGAISFCTIFFAFSGGTAFSTWDDTVQEYPLPNKPSQLQHGEEGKKDVYATRYRSRLAAIQAAYQDLQGADPLDFKFANFYYPFIGENNKEVIAAGIYYNSKFYFCCVDPNRELGEIWNLQLCVGADIFDLEMEGHKFYVGAFDISTGGLNVADMTIEYTNTKGVTYKVNGQITQDYTDHYE